jgi:DNA-binding NarL/FixJ family response regulator
MNQVGLTRRKIRLLLVTRTGSSPERLQLDDLLQLKTRDIERVFAEGVACENPDVLLLESKMPEEHWRPLFELTPVPVIVAGSASLDHYVIPCLIAGARGYIPDDAMPRHIRDAAETVLRGDVYAGPALVSRLFAYLASLSMPMPERLHESPPADLSVAETRVLHLIAQGLSNQSIADSLGVSRHTVANHVHSLLKKLSAKNRREAVARAAGENARVILF